MRVPAVVRAVLIGLVAGLLGSGAWAGLASLNVRHGAAVPWSVPVMAIVLLAWWRYFGRGHGWPAATADARRQGARANPVPDHLWGPALGAGLLGLVGVLLLQGLLGRLVALPSQQGLDASRYPAMTVFAWLVMSAVVAGVVEETAFRGYMQRGIEQRYGPLVAILVTGSLFGVAHFSHPEVGVVLLPYYIAVAAVYGGLAYAVNSTLPSMVLHAGGNVFSALSLLTQGRSEWQLDPRPAPLVWQTGVDAAFVANFVAVLAAAVATFVAYKALFRSGRGAQVPDA